MFTLSDFLPLMFESLNIEMVVDGPGQYHFNGDIVVINTMPVLQLIHIHTEAETLDDCYNQLRAKVLSIREAVSRAAHMASSVSPAVEETHPDSDEDIPF